MIKSGKSIMSSLLMAVTVSGLTALPSLAQHNLYIPIPTSARHNTIIPTDETPVNRGSAGGASIVGSATVVYVVYNGKVTPHYNKTVEQILKDLGVRKHVVYLARNTASRKGRFLLFLDGMHVKKIVRLPAIAVSGGDHALRGIHTDAEVKEYLRQKFGLPEETSRSETVLPRVMGESCAADTADKVKVGDMNKPELLSLLSTMGVQPESKFLDDLDSTFAKLSKQGKGSIKVFRSDCGSHVIQTMGGCRPVIVCCDGNGDPYVILVCY